MEQVLIGGYYDLLPSGTTEYNTISGGSTWDSTEASMQTVIPTDGIIKALYVVLTAAPGAGKNFIFTLRVNGAGSALTCTISDAATSNSDLVHEVSVVAGDKVSIECDPNGTPATPYARWSMVFEGDTANESIILGGANTFNGGTSYHQLQDASFSNKSTETDARVVCPCAGVIKKLYVDLTADPGTDPDAYRITLRKGAGGGAMASTTLTVTITADATTGNDVAHDVTVAAGDYLTIMTEPLNSPSASPKARFGMVFLADVDGESPIMGGNSDNLSTADTEYHYLQGQLLATWLITESQRLMQAGQACTFKDLHVRLSAAPAAGKSYTFTLRKNSAASTLTVAIADANTYGSDTANDVGLDDDTVGLEVVPAGTPTSVDAYWGLVCYIEPAGWSNITKIKGVSAASYAKVRGIAVASIAKRRGIAV